VKCKRWFELGLRHTGLTQDVKVCRNRDQRCVQEHLCVVCVNGPDGLSVVTTRWPVSPAIRLSAITTP
jgi:hypothetical protein